MQRGAQLLLFGVGLLTLACGGGGSSTPTPPPVPPVIASFTATPATINAGQGATLTWSVSGATSLSLSNGVGDVTGLNSKSVSPAATTTYMLTATNGGGSVAASATVTVNPAQVISVSVSPASASLRTGQTLSFAATVTGTPNTAVTWSVQEGTTGGTVNTSGLYTAPSTAGTYHVVATSVADPSKGAQASVTVSSVAPPYPVGLSDASIQVGSVTRDFRVHVPASLPSPPRALVLVLHGGGGEGLDVANTGAHPLSVFRTVADREGFIVVYPGGLPTKDGKPGWDDCRGDNLMASGADDLAFLDALIARVRGEYGLPIARVFMSGGSNGAQMTLAYALTRAANVAAVATSNGNLPLTPKPGACSAGPSQPVPILMTHGSADTQMPYDGGCVANVGGNCARGKVISAEATRDAWLVANGLTGVTPTHTVIDLDPTDGGPANRFVYAGVAPVEWWRLDGAGHTVASRLVLKDSNPLTGIQNRDVEFAEAAWAFFKARLPQSAPPPSPQAIQAARDYTFACGGQSFLVMHNGTVLDEAYANGGGADKPQLLASATKGFTGMIGAIAASEGLFDLEEPVAQRALVEWQGDPQKSRITYRHLLTMTSGLVELNDLAGWLDYLRAPVAFPAGSTFAYSGDPNIFGLALERRLGGEAVVDYFHRKLFQPLGITSIRWGSNFQDGHPQLSGGAYVTARDWARFGEFVRRTLDCTWAGPSLLAKPFFDRVFTGDSAHPAYGFYWWLKETVPADLAALIDANNKSQYTRDIKPIVDDPRIPEDFVMAAGAYDQRLYIIPSLGLTVVRHGPTGLNAFEDVQFLDRLLGGNLP